MLADNRLQDWILGEIGALLPVTMISRLTMWMVVWCFFIDLKHRCLSVLWWVSDFLAQADQFFSNIMATRTSSILWDDNDVRFVVDQTNFEDTEWVTGSRKSNDRQYNGQMKKDKQWSLDCPFLISPSVFSNVYYLKNTILKTKTSMQQEPH